jgi:hypothetical protein
MRVRTAGHSHTKDSAQRLFDDAELLTAECLLDTESWRMRPVALT